MHEQVVAMDGGKDERTHGGRQALSASRARRLSESRPASVLHVRASRREPFHLSLGDDDVLEVTTFIASTSYNVPDTVGTCMWRESVSKREGDDS